MLKKNLLLAALASMLAFSAGCKKDEEKKGDEAAKPAEKADDKAEAKAEDKPAEKAEEKAEEKADEAPAAAADLSGLSKEEIAEKAMKVFTDMADAVKAAGSDCDKLGADLDKIITDAKPIMDAGKKFDEDPEAKKWFDETYGKKVEEVMGGMMAGIMACAENEAVKAAMEKME